MTESKIGLDGAGVIGRAHLAGARIVGIADPNPAAEALAKEFHVPWFKDHRDLLDAARPDGVIIATPDAPHAPLAMEFIATGEAVVVEKPITDPVKEGLRLAQAAAHASVPILVGHHRRHNPIIRAPKGLVRKGKVVTLVLASVPTQSGQTVRFV